MPKPNPPRAQDSDRDIVLAIGHLREEVLALRERETGQSEATKAELARQIKQRVAAQLYLFERLAHPPSETVLHQAHEAIWAARALKVGSPPAPGKPPTSPQEWQDALVEVRGWCGLP